MRKLTAAISHSLRAELGAQDHNPEYSSPGEDSYHAERNLEAQIVALALRQRKAAAPD